MFFVIRPVVMTDDFHSIRFKVNNFGSQRRAFFMPLRHSQPQFLYSVANPISCRNNFDKNQANFLESAKNPRTFASVI